MRSHRHSVFLPRFSVQIQNDSEVAVSYSVSAENQYNNLPLTFTLLDNTTPVGEAKLAPGETKNLALQIYWDERKPLWREGSV